MVIGPLSGPQALHLWTVVVKPDGKAAEFVWHGQSSDSVIV